jgi:Chromosome segregation protein Spc25
MLRFCFTKLDPSDQSREFSFLLLVDEEDKFDIVECQPTIEATELIEILAELNRTEDMSALARQMRKCWDRGIYCPRCFHSHIVASAYH